jgi:hypothetical protein
MSSSSVSTTAPHTASRTLIASVMGARTPTKLGGKQVLRCETTLPQCGEEARIAIVCSMVTEARTINGCRPYGFPQPPIADRSFRQDDATIIRVHSCSSFSLDVLSLLGNGCSEYFTSEITSTARTSWNVRAVPKTRLMLPPKRGSDLSVQRRDR